MISAEQALEKLKQGNQRYVAGQSTLHDPKRREAGMQGQAPFAVVMGCSDSRAPVELVFDQDVGDLFTIRVAGNIVAPPETGTAEYAAENLGTRLIVVMGHTNCGAVTAAVDTLGQADAGLSPNLASFVEPIQAAIKSVDANTRAEKIQQGVRANARAAARDILNESDSLRHLAETDGLKVVAAEYALETGEVTFLD